MTDQTTPASKDLDRLMDSLLSAIQNSNTHDRYGADDPTVLEARAAIHELFNRRCEIAAPSEDGSCSACKGSGCRNCDARHIAPTAPAEPIPAPTTVDWLGLALELEAQAKRVESQTVERSMLAAAHGLRLLGRPSPAPAPEAATPSDDTRPAQAPVGWKPIETAAKDGEFVSLWCPLHFHKHDQTHLPMTGRWFGGYWVVVNADLAIQRVEPTHFMPLPAAPSPKGTL